MSTVSVVAALRHCSVFDQSLPLSQVDKNSLSKQECELLMDYIDRCTDGNGVVLT